MLNFHNIDYRIFCIDFAYTREVGYNIGLYGLIVAQCRIDENESFSLEITNFWIEKLGD